MSTPERDLAIGIIDRALRDAIGDAADTDYPKLAEREACDWFNTGGADFRTICAIADLDPAAVQQGYHRAMGNKTATRQRLASKNAVVTDNATGG